MRVAAACQLSLPVDQTGRPADRWGQLPEEARAQVLVLLARLIARGVLVADEVAADEVAERGAGCG
jgi:hypothetical protein